MNFTLCSPNGRYFVGLLFQIFRLFSRKSMNNIIHRQNKKSFAMFILKFCVLFKILPAPDSHSYLANLVAMVAKCFPWEMQTSFSKSEGLRDPSGPANVPDP